LLRLGAPSTHVWVKSEGAGRASRAQNSNSLNHFWQRFILSHKHRSTKGCVNNEIWYTSEAHAKQRNMHAPIQNHTVGHKLTLKSMN
ncbi:hypothetical protein BHM03_00021810, partial [Ensete ventricosum]